MLITAESSGSGKGDMAMMERVALPGLQPPILTLLPVAC